MALIYLVILIVVLALSFGFTGLVIKGICWAFGFAFSWKIAFGIWLVLALIGRMVKSKS